MIANKLKPGDTIGIISPSHVASEEQYAPILSAIEAMGFRVLCGKNLYNSTYGYSASERERADDLNAMARDGRLKMVLFGGGEGGNALLPYIDYDAIGRNPKIYCSYSDGTTILNAIHSKTGLVTYYGQSPGIFSDLRHYDYLQFHTSFVEGTADFQKSGAWRVLHGGNCKGVLTGGYTRNFALLQGSSHFHFDADKSYILFLEDHEKFSDVATVSSYLSHIEQSELMSRLSGLLFGHYAAAVHPDLMGRLERFGQKHRLPVVYCDDFGHGVHHAVLPIGIEARLDADRQSLVYDAF